MFSKVLATLDLMYYWSRRRSQDSNWQFQNAIYLYTITSSVSQGRFETGSRKFNRHGLNAVTFRWSVCQAEHGSNIDTKYRRKSILVHRNNGTYACIYCPIAFIRRLIRCRSQFFLLVKYSNVVHSRTWSRTRFSSGQVISTPTIWGMRLKTGPS